ncbi:hypothetical protein [Streptomyces africanus]|uniref:hypothetical protein n=1 Tax=Streptomyces africanus TaxID=231024 RepID=UPI000A36854E|nr:hypothetical protein [Streptomyces africanus]
MSKGGGHSKGQTMPYAVVYAWDGGKPARNAKWSLGAAEAAMLDTLRASNARGGKLEIRIIDRATDETVAEPQRCAVCGDNWATEARDSGQPTVCRDCEHDVEDGPQLDASDRAAFRSLAARAGLVKAPAESAPLVAALQARKLHPVAQPNGTVTVTVNGIEWTLEPVPHAVTGEPCGVWSAVGPAGSRGQFVALNAAEFVAQRRVP